MVAVVYVRNQGGVDFAWDWDYWSDRIVAQYAHSEVHANHTGKEQPGWMAQATVQKSCRIGWYD